MFWKGIVWEPDEQTIKPTFDHEKFRKLLDEVNKPDPNALPYMPWISPYQPQLPHDVPINPGDWWTSPYSFNKPYITCGTLY